MPIHETPSPLAGKTVRLRPDYYHPEVVPGNLFAVIEDWWDRMYGKSWMDATGNPAALIYAIRSAQAHYRLPIDDNVVYGKVGGLGHIIHVSEIIFDEEKEKIVEGMMKDEIVPEPERDPEEGTEIDFRVHDDKDMKVDREEEMGFPQ